MDSSHLTPQQAEALTAKIAPMVGYLHSLVNRMERTGFPPDDDLFRLTQEAHQKLHHLRMHLHYLSCEQRVGRQRR
jgi:hypothetical protein